MSLTAGTRLGPYEILAATGAGGMGEVYRAEDTRLDCDIAVKVLPAGSSRRHAGRSALRPRGARHRLAQTGARYDTTTATNGGYTIKVPEGTYRIEIELRTGEALAKHPDDTQINNGDLDSGRDFVITVKAADQ